MAPLLRQSKAVTSVGADAEGCTTGRLAACNNAPEVNMVEQWTGFEPGADGGT